MTLPRPALAAKARESHRCRQHRIGVPAGCSALPKRAGPCRAQKRACIEIQATPAVPERGGRNEPSAGAQPGTLARVERDGPPQHDSASRGWRVSKHRERQSTARRGHHARVDPKRGLLAQRHFCSRAQRAGQARAECLGRARPEHVLAN